jgi:hypothetical protein
MIIEWLGDGPEGVQLIRKGKFDVVDVTWLKSQEFGNNGYIISKGLYTNIVSMQQPQKEHRNMASDSVLDSQEGCSQRCLA